MSSFGFGGGSKDSGIKLKATPVHAGRDTKPGSEPIYACSTCPGVFQLGAVSRPGYTYIYNFEGGNPKPVYKHNPPADAKDAPVYHAWYLQQKEAIQQEKDVFDQMGTMLDKTMGFKGKESGAASWEPVVAVTCGRYIDVVRVVPPEKKGAPLEFIHMLNLAIREEICSVKWVSERIMVLLDVQQKVAGLWVRAREAGPE